MKIIVETLRIFVIFAIFTLGIIEIALLSMQESPNSSGIEY